MEFSGRDSSSLLAISLLIQVSRHVKFGIMQGRLSLPVGGAFQAFPYESWEAEFIAGADIGIHCIEWIYDIPGDGGVNPIESDEGRDAIRSCIGATGVEVRSVCADWFMNPGHHLIAADGEVDAPASRRLRKLLGDASALGCDYVILPFVDASRIANEKQRLGLLGYLTSLGDLLEELGVEIHIESDLSPPQLAEFFATGLGRRVRWNYDMGNSASLGFDPIKEFKAVGAFLGSVHVKDRLRGGGTVPPGTGDTDLKSSLGQVFQAGFDRPLIMQVARGVPGDEKEWIRAAIKHVQTIIETLV